MEAYQFRGLRARSLEVTPGHVCNMLSVILKQTVRIEYVCEAKHPLQQPKAEVYHPPILLEYSLLLISKWNLTIKYTDPAYTFRFSLIGRIRLSLPTSCHWEAFPCDNPDYIPPAESCCSCQVNSSYHRVRQQSMRSRGTRWNVLTISRSARRATPSVRTLRLPPRHPLSPAGDAVTSEQHRFRQSLVSVGNRQHVSLQAVQCLR